MTRTARWPPVLLLLLLHAEVARPAAAATRPFALQDVVDLRSIEGIAVSPDGRSAAFTVWSADLEGRRFTSDLWIVRLDGSEPERRLTFAKEDDTAPKWSPDGRLIGFLSERGGMRQVWALPSAGGEAEPLTMHPEPISSFDWAPDGKRILVVARPPETGDEAAARKAGDDGFIVGRSWSNARLFIADLAAGGARSLTPVASGTGHVQPGAAWSPDGRFIAFISTPTPEADASEEARVQVVEAPATGGPGGPGGTPRDVPGSERATALSWSPDGRRLAIVRPFDGKGWSREDLFLWPVDRGAGGAGAHGAPPRDVSGDLDRDVEAVLWDREGGALDLLYSRGTAHEIARLDKGAAPPRTAWKPGCSLGSLQRAGTSWVFVRGGRPDEVWIGSPAAPPRRLTRLNAVADGIDLPAIETVRWRGPESEIEGVLVYPPAYDPRQRYPLILRVHGGPRLHINDAFDPQVAYLAARGFLVLRPNPRGSTGYGDRFAKRNAANWGDGPFRDIMAGADALVARGIADPGRLFLYGWSYGGYMANWAATHTDRLKAVASGAGVADLRLQYTISDARRWRFDYFSGSPFSGHEAIYEQESPVTYARQAKVPTLFVHGENDVRCPLAQGLMMHRAIADQGVPTELLIYPREGHEFGEPRHVMDRIRRVADWFARFDAPGSFTGKP